jgi:nucleoid-associated protein YgaU
MNEESPMGLIDFVKDAGESLLEKVGEGREAAGKAVSKRIQGLGLSVDGLKVDVDGDRAVLSGTAASQAEREKAVLAAGNIQGVAQVDDRLSVASAESQFHRVVSGDTLSKIAKQYYGDTSKYPEIFEANQPMLTSPDKIYPGQVLRIPPLAD